IRAGQITRLERTAEAGDGRARRAEATGFLVCERGVTEAHATTPVETQCERVIRGGIHPAPSRAGTATGSGAPGTSMGGWSRHSLWVSLSHHQRPARSCSPGLVARVHGAHPIDR